MPSARRTPLADHGGNRGGGTELHCKRLAKAAQIGIQRRRQARQQPGTGFDHLDGQAGIVTVATQYLAQRLDTRDAAAGDHDAQRLALLHERMQSVLDRQGVGDVAEGHGVTGDARDVMCVPHRAHRHDAGIEFQFAAAGRDQPALRRLQRGHAIAQEAVSRLLDDGGAVQAQPLGRLHARDDLVDVGHPLEVSGRVDDCDRVAWRQLDRGRQAGEIAADDGDALALVGHWAPCCGVRAERSMVECDPECDRGSMLWPAPG